MREKQENCQSVRSDEERLDTARALNDPCKSNELYLPLADRYSRGCIEHGWACLLRQYLWVDNFFHSERVILSPRLNNEVYTCMSVLLVVAACLDWYFLSLQTLDAGVLDMAVCQLFDQITRHFHRNPIFCSRKVYFHSLNTFWDNRKTWGARHFLKLPSSWMEEKL